MYYSAIFVDVALSIEKEIFGYNKMNDCEKDLSKKSLLRKEAAIEEEKRAGSFWEGEVNSYCTNGAIKKMMVQLVQLRYTWCNWCNIRMCYEVYLSGKRVKNARI
jgi:hypothetical protein